MALPLTPAAARIQDPVLTRYAIGHRHQKHIWPILCPPIPVGARAGKRPKWDKTDFLALDLRRSPMTDVQEISYAYSDETFTLIQRALTGKIGMEQAEEARAVPGGQMQLQIATARRTMDQVSLAVEVATASLFTQDATYTDSAGSRITTLAGSAQWSDDSSSPDKAIREKFEAIETSGGQEPNLLLLGAKAWNALLVHNDVVDRTKYTRGLAGAPAIRKEDLEVYFGIRCERLASLKALEADGPFSRVWGDKIAILAYVNESPMSQEDPSFGVSYRLNGYPRVLQPRFDLDSFSWKHPVLTEDSPTVGDKKLGYLFKAVVA